MLILSNFVPPAWKLHDPYCHTAGPAYIIPKDYINCLYQMAMKSSSKLYMEDIFITGILRDKCNIELKFVLQILNFPPKKYFLQSLSQCKIFPLSKGQLNSEWIYEVIVSPKMPNKKFPDFCPNLSGQKSGKFLVGILGETMTS